MTIYTAQYQANSCQLIEVQSHLSNGYSGVISIGNISKTCQDGIERSRVALEKYGIDLPAQKLVLSFAPASLRKDGNQFDLPIAVSIAQLLDPKKFHAIERCLYVGELDLNGNLKPVKNMISFVLMAVENHIQHIICPSKNQDSINVLLSLRKDLLKEVSFHFVDALSQVLSLLQSVENQTPLLAGEGDLLSPQKQGEIEVEQLNFDDMILSEEMHKAALATVVGRHNALLRGCPGSGKSMWANRLSSIQPKLDKSDHMETLKIYSSMEERLDKAILAGRPPFRSPHHQASAAAVLGTPYSAGELTLAYGGLLFLDEFPEFRRDLLEALREPLETGEVQVSRANMKVRWKCRTQLIAACNNCPCGWFGSSVQRCKCSMQKLMHYYHKISGPLLDRIDIHILFEKPQVQSLAALSGGPQGINKQTQEMKDIVARVQGFSAKRLEQLKVHSNAQMSPQHLMESFAVNSENFERLTSNALEYYKSTRSLFRALKVARSLADLELSVMVRPEHLEQAKQWSSQFILERIGAQRF